MSETTEGQPAPAGDEDEFSDRRSGEQRRGAFRVAMRMPVYVDAPMQSYCELVDISVLGLRLDAELPCTPGVLVDFRLVVPSYGATPKPEEIELFAEVVRVNAGFTGLRFTRLAVHQARAVRKLVQDHQRRLLLAQRPAALDRRRARTHAPAAEEAQVADDPPPGGRARPVL